MERLTCFYHSQKAPIFHQSRFVDMNQDVKFYIVFAVPFIIISAGEKVEALRFLLLLRFCYLLFGCCCFVVYACMCVCVKELRLVDKL